MDQWNVISDDMLSFSVLKHKKAVNAETKKVLNEAIISNFGDTWNHDAFKLFSKALDLKLCPYMSTWSLLGACWTPLRHHVDIILASFWHQFDTQAIGEPLGHLLGLSWQPKGSKLKKRLILHTHFGPILEPFWDPKGNPKRSQTSILNLRPF